jgi:putative tryptophan/tyrosine transport system substrate-binding protein
VNRRELLLLLGGAMMAVRSLRAQQPKIPRVGILSPAENEARVIFEAFRQGLRELGYVEGRNIILEYRFAHGDFSALPRLAEELASLPVDVIVADTTASTRAAAGAAPSIPIVMGAGIDPVALGLAHSLARPGGNVTGFTLMSHELSAKRVDLMRTAFPDAVAMMVLANPTNPGSTEVNLRVTEETARSLGLALTRLEAATPEALRALRPEALGRGGGPVLVLPDAMFWNHRREILALVAAARLPALYPEREYADDGGASPVSIGRPHRGAEAKRRSSAGFWGRSTPAPLCTRAYSPARTAKPAVILPIGSQQTVRGE